MASARAKRDTRGRLDSRFARIGSAQEFARPQRGWVRAIREALGMSAADLGARMGVSAQSVYALEASEVGNGARLDTLARAAAAMDCTFVYALIPKSSLQGMVESQAERRARELFADVAHTMALEDQSSPDDADQRRNLARDLIDSSQLWSTTS